MSVLPHIRYQYRTSHIPGSLCALDTPEGPDFTKLSSGFLQAERQVDTIGGEEGREGGMEGEREEKVVGARLGGKAEGNTKESGKLRHLP